MIIQDLGKSIEEYKAKRVMVDSIIALHRAEFAGTGTLAERQQRLNLMLHKLSRLAEVHSIAVVVFIKSTQMISLQAGMVYVLQVETLWAILLRTEFF
jgi:RecA/RadA recombinase